MYSGIMMLGVKIDADVRIVDDLKTINGRRVDEF